MEFGFSYVGLIFLLGLFIPNIIFGRYMPEGFLEDSLKENKFLVILERIGEALSTITVLFFKDFNLHEEGKWFLLTAVVIMVIYELAWRKYFKSNQTLVDMYKPYLGIPLPLATLPVLAFLFLSFYANNIILFVATIILGISHILIHYNHYKDLK